MVRMVRNQKLLSLFLYLTIYYALTALEFLPFSGDLLGNLPGKNSALDPVSVRYGIIGLGKNSVGCQAESAEPVAFAWAPAAVELGRRSLDQSFPEQRLANLFLLARGELPQPAISPKSASTRRLSCRATSGMRPGVSSACRQIPTRQRAAPAIKSIFSD